GTAVWAGTEYPARPGESVVANELIVRMRPGVHAATVAPNYLPGARVDSLGKERLYKISVSTGISTAAASRLALDALVEFVEPNRLRHTTVAAPNDPNYGSS